MSAKLTRRRYSPGLAAATGAEGAEGAAGAAGAEGAAGAAGGAGGTGNFGVGVTQADSKQARANSNPVKLGRAFLWGVPMGWLDVRAAIALRLPVFIVGWTLLYGRKNDDR